MASDMSRLLGSYYSDSATLKVLAAVQSGTCIGFSTAGSKAIYEVIYVYVEAARSSSPKFTMEPRLLGVAFYHILPRLKSLLNLDVKATHC